MANLYRPNSVTMFDSDTEENINIYIRVDEGSDKIVFAVMADEEEHVSDHEIPIDHVLALIVDLTTAVQVALSNRVRA